MRHLEIRLAPLVVGCRFRRQARLVSVNIVVGKLFSPYALLFFYFSIAHEVLKALR